jgi:hypothetical protein
MVAAILHLGRVGNRRGYPQAAPWPCPRFPSSVAGGMPIVRPPTEPVLARSTQTVLTSDAWRRRAPVVRAQDADLGEQGYCGAAPGQAAPAVAMVSAKHMSMVRELSTRRWHSSK